MTLWQLLMKGGVMMIPIGVVSFVAAALFFERLWALRMSRVAPAELRRKVLQLLRNQGRDAAVSACAADESALSRIVLSALKHPALSREALKERVEEAGAQEVPWMNRFVEGVGTVAAVAPLLGLLGTVTGMISVFQEVASADNPHVSQLAGGIWEALITTGAGLTVAIPAYLAYRWLQSVVDRRVELLEATSLDLVDVIIETRDLASATTDESPRA